MSMIHVENWTRKDVQFRFLYASGMAEGALKRNAACPTKMSVPPGCVAFVWRIDNNDGNKHWIPTQKVTFDAPLKGDAPPKRIVLKVPRKDESTTSSAPPTPVSEKLRKNFGPGSPSDKAYRDLIATLEKTPGQKFVDGSFDLSRQNCTNATKIDWVRPTTLSSNPRLFPENAKKDDADDIDLQQGNLGDCWLIATLAMLYSFDRGLLHNLLVEYRPKLGIVLCRFCKEGEWKYVLIDDRVPVVGMKMCYAHHENPNLFWGPFIEKAYAKLHGGYSQIVGGKIQYASTDLTGHFSDSIDLNRWRREADANMDGVIDEEECQKLIRRLMADRERNKNLNIRTMGGCVIRNPHTEKVREDGLIAGHAYSILREKTIEYKEKTVHLVELRNPWGVHEWKGEWCDDDPKWKDPEVKKQIDFEPGEDGSFWMSLNSFLRIFDDVYTVPFWNAQDGKIFVDVERGEWIEETSGGSGAGPGGINNWKRNPQYQFRWEPDSDSSHEVLKVFLYQEDRVWKDTKTTTEEHRSFFPISVQVWKQENNGERLDAPLKRLMVKTPSYERARHITVTLDDLPPGTYVLVPTTFHMGQLCSFVIGICCSERVNLEHLTTDFEQKRIERCEGSYRKRRNTIDEDGAFFGDNVARDDDDEEEEEEEKTPAPTTSAPTAPGEQQKKPGYKRADAFFSALPDKTPPPVPRDSIVVVEEEEESEESEEESDEEEEEEEEEEEDSEDEELMRPATHESKRVLVPGGHKNKLEVNGKWDKQSVIALQLYLNAMWSTTTKWSEHQPRADGNFNVATIKSLQMLLRADGRWKKNQKITGKVDGTLISACTKFLNARWKLAQPVGRKKKLRSTPLSTWPISVVSSFQTLLNNVLKGKDCKHRGSCASLPIGED